jgi:hypothetical protein
MSADEYAHLARDLFPRVRETELANSRGYANATEGTTSSWKLARDEVSGTQPAVRSSAYGRIRS